MACLCTAAWSGLASAQAPPRRPQAPPGQPVAPPPAAPGAIAPPAAQPAPPAQPAQRGHNEGQAQQEDERNPATGDLPGPIDNLQDLQDTGKMVFKIVDTNNDGQISKKEAIDAGDLAVGGLFFRADANGDGKLSREEGKQARDALVKQKPMLRAIITRVSNRSDKKEQSGETPSGEPILLAIFDTNNDQQLEATELRKAVETTVQSIYDTSDSNHDGQLSPTEVNAAMIGAVRAAQQAAFQAADANRDGQLSRDEFDKALAEPAHVVFAMVDANSDGQISQQEAQQARDSVLAQARMLRVPEPANSLRNVIQGQDPDQVAPIPNFGRAANRTTGRQPAATRSTTTTAAPGR